MNKGIADIFRSSDSERLLKYGSTINWRAGEVATENDYVPDSFGLWLSGFADGESCFSITKATVVFIIKLRDDDAPVLEYIQRTVGGIGKFYYSGGDGKNRRRQAEWRVWRRKETLWLTDFFDRFPLRSKKARDYAVWREAVIARFSGAGDLSDYMAQIRAARAYPETVAA